MIEAKMYIFYLFNCLPNVELSHFSGVQRLMNMFNKTKIEWC